MRKKIISLTVIFVLALSASGVALIVIASSDKGLPDYVPIDVGPRLRDSNPTINFDTLEKTSAGGGFSIASDYVEGEEVWGLWYDDLSGLYYMKYTVRAVGTFAEIWVANDLDWADPTNDPRPTPVVTDAQVIYLLSQYDNNIHPTVTDYYGEPDFHDGSNAWLGPGYYDENGRTIIMVSNIGDENYYDPTYPSYIAGFYWSLYQDYFDRNIINIDSYDWVNRVGPDGARPFMYEGTIAHELQHLIHSDLIPGNELFINEGFADFAGMLCGYGTPWGHINTYLATPDNSLTEWGDQGGINILADYGAAALFAIYLNDQFGEDFISDFMAAGIPGFAGLNFGFGPFGVDFDQVYHDWRIANLIHWGDGVYNYQSIDLGSKEAEPARVYDVRKLPVPLTTGTNFGTTITGYGGGYDTGKVTIKPYGSDYIRFDAGKYISEDWFETLYFDGDDIAIVGWQEIDSLWWSDEYSLMNTVLTGAAYVDPEDPILTLDTYWDIEDDFSSEGWFGWDYGFIQVSTDDGATWTSLANEYTFIEAHPSTLQEIIDNQPGLTSWSWFFDTDENPDDGWISMTFDLSEYADNNILVGFRYMTDWYTTYDGWYIESASVSGDDLDLSPADDYPEADFQVSVIYELKGKNKWDSRYEVLDLDLDDFTETGQIDLMMDLPSNIFLVVSPIQPIGHVDYSFEVTTTYIGD